MRKGRFFRKYAVMAAAGSLMLLGCSPTLDWRTMRPQHSPELQAAFPCRPTQVDRVVKLAGLPGPPVTVHLVSCSVRGTTWALSYFDAQEVSRVSPALVADHRSLLGNLEALGRMAPPPKGAVVPVTAEDQGPTAIPGMTPNDLSRHWRFQAQRPSEQGQRVAIEVHAWHFSHGLMVYQATLWRPIPPANAKESTEAVETFIQGFKFSE